jgi:hypothetical protein
MLSRAKPVIPAHSATAPLQRAARDAQQLGGAGLVAGHRVEHRQDVALFQRVQVGRALQRRARLRARARQALVQRRHVERTDDQRALDQVAQLAHVARPVVLLQVGHLVGRDLDRLHAQLRRQRVR